MRIRGKDRNSRKCLLMLLNGYMGREEDAERGNISGTLYRAGCCRFSGFE